MSYDKTKLLSNIRVISLAIKNIEKGFCKSNPVNYIMDVYEMDMRTSVDVCKLDHDIIDIVLDYVNNNTSDDEEALILFLQENKITKPIINYILDRNDDISDENCEYTVKIVYDDSLNYEETIVGNNGRITSHCHYKYTNYYNIYNKTINVDNNLKLTKIYNGSNNDDQRLHCKSFNFYEYYDINNKMIYKKRICVNLSDDKILSNNKQNSKNCKHCEIPTFGNNATRANFLQIWFPNEYYSANDKYLIFYSKIFVAKLLSTNSYNIYEFELDNKFKIDNDIIKIPLIDGLRMKTPIGFASVKKTKTIDEYLTVNRWTDDDFDNYSK